MPRHRRKRMALERRDHRVDIGPAGRNIFISRDKQLQSRQAKRIKVLMRLVMVLVGLVVAVGVGLFVALYMVPYFQAEISLDSSSSAQGGGLSSLSQVEMPTYDLSLIHILDQGGGGTVALDISRMNADVIDVGVPVLSMHSPFEVVSKLDVYMAYKGFKAYFEAE